MKLAMNQGKGDVTGLTMTEGDKVIADLVIDPRNTTGPTEAMGGTAPLDRADEAPRDQVRRP